MAGFVIEILCKPDGSFSVEVESLEHEMEEQEDHTGQPAASFAEAMKLAKQMYDEQAGETEGGSEDMGENEMSPEDMWNEEAAKRLPPTATGRM